MAPLSAAQFGATSPAQAQSPNTPNPTGSIFAPAQLPGAPAALGHAHPPHTGDTGQHIGTVAIKGASPTPLAPEAPLPGMASVYGSVKEAAAWRKPNQVLPLAKGTFGSTFNPF